MARQLGCQPKRVDSRTLRLARYLDKTKLPAAPETVIYSEAVPQPGMLLNDQLGCCVPAGAMHLALYQAANDGHPLPMPSDEEVIRAYSAIGGYVPGDPDTDNGCTMLDALRYWRREGIVIGGKAHKIGAFAEINLQDAQEVASALWLFGGLYAAFDLPAAAEELTSWSGLPTELVGDWMPGSWGGHCVTIPDVRGSAAGDTYGVCTWGGITPMDPCFWQAYASEAYVVLSEDWLGRDGRCPAGFNKATLLADLQSL